MFIYTVSYFLIIYILGLYTGFLSNPMNLSILSIIKSALPMILLIICEEKYRTYAIRDEKNVSIFLTTFFIILISILISLPQYNFENLMDILEYAGRVVIGVTMANIMLTFTAKNYGSIPNIVYRLITECYVFFVPIIPNLGPYLSSVFAIILPIIIFIRINTLTIKQKFVVVKENKFKKAVVTIPLILLVTLIIALISGVFRYNAIAIVSNSMVPTFQRGSVVVYEKLDKEDLINIEKNDIIIFKNDNKILVHRVVDILKYSNKIEFITKGDNNEAKDDFRTPDSDVIGEYITSIPYIGYPSVWLTEQLH